MIQAVGQAAAALYHHFVVRDRGPGAHASLGATAKLGPTPDITPETPGTRAAAACSGFMEPDRPFSGPVSIGLAGLTLAGLAAWSFGSGLTRELRLSHAEIPPAHVVVLAPKPSAPPPSADLAYVAALPPEPAPPAHRARRHARPDASAPILQNIQPAPAAEAAGVDAAATAPEAPAPSPPDTASPPDTDSPPTP